MSERPFMQLYVSDFIGDTLSLSTEQIGAYMLLLMAMWNAGGKLPADDAKLARVTRMSVKKWKAIASDIMPFFEVDGESIWHNRLTKELKKSESKSQSRSVAGAEGGRAKALKDKEARLANAMPKSQHLPDTITRDISSLRSDEKVLIKPDFDTEFESEFWPAYPRKVGKGHAKSAYRTARKHADKETIIAGVRRYASERAGQDPTYTKHAKTWLNSQGWGDEPAPRPTGHGPPQQRQRPHRQRQDEVMRTLDEYLGIKANDDEFTSNGPTLDLEPGNWNAH